MTVVICILLFFILLALMSIRWTLRDIRKAL
jgi:hypothetical protein